MNRDPLLDIKFFHFRMSNISFLLVLSIHLTLSTAKKKSTSNQESHELCVGAGARANSHEINAIGVMHQKSGNFDLARSCYLAALRKRKRFVSPIFNLGTLDMATGNINQAVEHFHKVLSLQPTYASAYYNIGTALIGLDELPLAVRNLQSAVSLDPNYVSAHANLATALQMQAIIIF